MKILPSIGICSDLGSNKPGSAEAPEGLMHSRQFNNRLIKQGVFLDWSIIKPQTFIDRLEALQKICCDTRRKTSEFVSKGLPFIAIGGDHSVAMGVWSGALEALKPEKLGLMWIDSHLDLHTFTTSPSLNIHGMPASALLGKYDAVLGKIYGSREFINPENMVFIGEHSHEWEEHNLIDNLGLKSFCLDNIQQAYSVESVFEIALQRMMRGADYFGVSIDLDVISPIDAPGVNTPVNGGMHFNDLKKGLEAIAGDKRLLGVEISEFNPLVDQDHKTRDIIASLIEIFFSTESSVRSST